LKRQKCFYFEEHWFKLCETKSEKMMKKFDAQKFLGEGVQGRHFGRIWQRP